MKVGDKFMVPVSEKFGVDEAFMGEIMYIHSDNRRIWVASDPVIINDSIKRPTYLINLDS